MTTYFARWTTVIEADSPREAAELAAAFARRADTMTMDVREHLSEEHIEIEVRPQ